MVANYCECSVVVSGVGASRFFEDLRDKLVECEELPRDGVGVGEWFSDSAELLGLFVPVPREVAQRSSLGFGRFLAGDKVGAFAFEELRLQEMYGASASHMWREKYWGVRREVGYLKVNFGEGWCAFNTAWAPPAEAFLRISQLYPDAVFRLAFCEAGSVMAGFVDIVGGCVVGGEDFGGRWWAEEGEDEDEWWEDLHEDLGLFLSCHHLQGIGG